MLKIKCVPLLSDNYGYLLHNEKDAVVIDPSEAEGVSSVLEEEGLTLQAIVNTHHHYDHVGGNERLSSIWNCPVFASSLDQGRVPGQTYGITDGEELDFSFFTLSAFATPGHTKGALTFQVGEHLFTGDTLFSLGCGRLFEGTPSELAHSIQTIMARKGVKSIFVGHEYTTRNLQWLRSLLPNQDLGPLEKEVSDQLTANNRSIPTTMERERKYNPFVRVADLKFREEIGMGHLSAQEAFAQLRTLKDQF